ncbi:Probable inactive receptor kinase At5g10020 [Linum grandiflorum]
MNYEDDSFVSASVPNAEPRKLSPLSLNERLRVAISIGGCLSFIHNQKGIPHGNLKSTNILLQPAHNNPMLTDYCLHRIITSAGTADELNKF